MTANPRPQTEPAGEEPQELSPSEALRELATQARGGDASPGETVVDTVSLIGRMLGQYRIVSRLGQGGMGMVFRAYDTHLDRDVALKVIFCGPLDDPKMAERFQREAQSMARLSHPNLLHVHNVGNDGAIYYFSMELIDGETLSQRMRRLGRLPVAETLGIAGQVLAALHYVHGRGVTHRDLKSSNIMLAGARAVLMDFGLAKDERQSGLTTIGSVVGTPEYMAPEQADGQPVGPYTDLYSLGVVLYETLTGQLPFTGRSALAIIRQHMDTPPPPLENAVPGIAPALGRAIQRCMAKRPSERYRDCAELAADLAEIYRTPELTALAQLRMAPTVHAASSVDEFRTTVLDSESSKAQASTHESGGAAESPKNKGGSHRRLPAWTWVTIGFAAVLLLAMSSGLLLRGRRDAQPPALNVNAPAGGPVFRLVQFRAAADQERWSYVVDVRQADGSWKRETVTGLQTFQKRFGSQEQPAP